MIKRDYANRILFMLSFKEMSGYQLSGNVQHHGENISSGTLVPILRNLESAGLITFRRSGNRKLYRLTDKGRNYVKSLRDIGNELKKKMLVESMDQNMLYYDILTNYEDVEAIKAVLDKLGEILIEIIKAGFYLEKRGRESELESLKKGMRSLIDEAYREASEEGRK